MEGVVAEFFGRSWIRSELLLALNDEIILKIACNKKISFFSGKVFIDR